MTTKDVQAVIETVGKNQSRLFLNASGLTLVGCQQPLDVYWLEEGKKANVSTCKRPGTSEIRNIDGGTLRLDGQKIEINIRIDDYIYDFRGAEIGK